MEYHWYLAIFPRDIFEEPNFGILAQLPLFGFPIFEGLPHECLFHHLDNFSFYYVTQGILENLISSYIFPITPKNRASQWYESLPPQSI